MIKQILIIEDEKEVAEIMSIWLVRAGYRPLLADCGMDGIAMASKERPNLIILDLMMPGMGGFEVLDRLKSDNMTKFIPVIISTGKADSDFIFKAQELESADYIIKPFKSQELLDMVKRHAI
ncbi:MAG: response regulator [Candidatus Omnitrophota bacterium]